MNVTEATIHSLRSALQSGRTTSAALVTAYLNRITTYDPILKAVPVLNTVPALNLDAIIFPAVANGNL